MSLKSTKNIFTGIPEQHLQDEVFDTLLENEKVKIERIISTGQTTPEGEWLDQAHDEWVILLRGRAIVTFDDGAEHRLQAGDYLHIAANAKHRVGWTDPENACVWLALHLR